MSIIEVKAINVPHPFSCYSSTTLLNVEAFSSIEGEGAYEEYSWSSDGGNFGVDVDVGTAVGLSYESLDLYENIDSITVVLPSLNRGYRYPKKDFNLVKKK